MPPAIAARTITTAAGITNFSHGFDDAGFCTACTLAEDAELDEASGEEAADVGGADTAAARPLVLLAVTATAGATDSTCGARLCTGTEEEEPAGEVLADEVLPESRSRFRRSNSDLISTAC